MSKIRLTLVITSVVFILFILTGCNQKEKIDETSMQEQAQIETTSEVTGEKVGDIISLGYYEQDNNTSNGKEPILWKVLAVENGKTLLISEKILDCIPYNNILGDVTWETCTLRKWLRNEFLSSTFSESEIAMITETKMVNGDNSITNTPGGNDTNDSVFVISYDEIREYFLNIELRLSAGTDFAKSKGLKVSDKANSLGNSGWWLRSPGFNSCAAWTVSSDGSYLRGCSNNVDSAIVGVRPAIWIFRET